MKKYFDLPLILTITALSLCSFTMKPKTYTYIDGNNNAYSIASTVVEYKPVSKENSSSGTYSGGEAKKITITTEQFLKIEGLINAIKKDKKNYVDTRQMGCGTLAVNNRKPVYIAMGSENKKALEAELLVILGK